MAQPTVYPIVGLAPLVGVSGFSKPAFISATGGFTMIGSDVPTINALGTPFAGALPFNGTLFATASASQAAGQTTNRPYLVYQSTDLTGTAWTLIGDAPPVSHGLAFGTFWQGSPTLTFFLGSATSGPANELIDFPLSAPAYGTPYGTGAPATNGAVGAVARRSDGSVVAFQNGTAFTGLDDLYYVWTSSGGWAAGAAWETLLFGFQTSAYLDAADRIHFVYQDGLAGTYYYNSLSSANVVGTRHQLQPSDFGVSATAVVPFAPHTDDAADKIYIVGVVANYPSGGVNSIVRWVGSSRTAPVWTTEVIFSSATLSASALAYGAASGGLETVMFTYPANNTQLYITWLSGGVWQTPVLYFDTNASYGPGLNKAITLVSFSGTAGKPVVARNFVRS